MTVGQALQRLHDRLGTSNANAALNRKYLAAYNDACEFIYGKRNWDWLYKVDTLSIAAATESSYSTDLPSDCRGVLAVGLMSRGVPLEPTSIEFEQVNRMAMLAYAAKYRVGTPEAWCARDGKLYLFPPPSSADTAVLCYIKKFVPFTDNSQSPDFPSDYHSAAVGLALADLADSDEYSQRVASRAQKKALAAINNMHMTGSNMQAVVQNFKVLIGQH